MDDLEKVLQGKIVCLIENEAEQKNLSTCSEQLKIYSEEEVVKLKKVVLQL